MICGKCVLNVWGHQPVGKSQVRQAESTCFAIEDLSRSSSSLTGRTTVEAVFNQTHPFTADETTAGVRQPKEWRKPGTPQEQSSQPSSMTK